MKTKKTQLTIPHTAKLALSLIASFLVGHAAQAHLTYSGRDFGTFSGLTNAAVAITNQTCTGNFGWANAADGILGDSHKGRAFRFRLNNAALVSLTIAANPNATGTSIGGLTPAYSIYSGLAALAPFPANNLTNNPPTLTSPDHDFSDASAVWRTWWVQQNLNPLATDPTPTDGSWNALGDWKIGGDGDLPGDFTQLSVFIYKGSVASTNSGGTATGSFVLPAGDYTVLVGGNDIANKTSDTVASGFGISATLTVTPAALGIAQKVFVACPFGSATNWVLESAATMDAANWTTVTNTPLVVDGQFGFVLDRNADQQYFRVNYVP